MTKALWAITFVILCVVIIQFMQYRLDYDYLYDNIPICLPEGEEGIIS